MCILTDGKLKIFKSIFRNKTKPKDHLGQQKVIVFNNNDYKMSIIIEIGDFYVIDLYNPYYSIFKCRTMFSDVTLTNLYYLVFKTDIVTNN